MSEERNVAKARAKLQDIFRNKTYDSSRPLSSEEKGVYDRELKKKRVHDEVLAILTQNPSLAAEKFSARYQQCYDDPDVEDNAPLFWFVMTAASFYHIEEVWKLHPKIELPEVVLLVREVPNIGHGSYAETILFLLEKQPQALFRYPVLSSLLSDTSLFPVEKIIAIMELDRHNSHSYDYCLRRYPISYALKYTENNDFLSYMSMKFPRNVDSLVVWECLPGGCAHLIGLLPQLKKLKLYEPCWTVEAMTSFASKLQSTASLVNFSLRYKMSWPSETVQALGLGFFGNCSIKTLVLSHSNRNEAPQCESLQLLSAGISEMKNLESLRLCWFYFAADTLVKFVASGKAPKKLWLDYCHLLPPHGSDLLADDDDDWGLCRVEDLSVFLRGKGDRQKVAEVFLSKIPLLRKLTMRDNDYTDISSGLTSALKRPTLAYFQTEGAVFDARGFCEALKTNSSLKTCIIDSIKISCPWTHKEGSLLVDVLSSSNTTLEKIYLAVQPSSIATQLSIQHWTRLNKFGRQKARSTSTLHDEFVLLLSKASEDLSPLEAFNVHYGLMRELPGNWSSRVTAQRIQGKKGENCDGKATPLEV